MSKLPAPGTSLVPSKSRIPGASSRTSNASDRGAAAPIARRIAPPGTSRLAYPTMSKKSSFSVIVVPDENVNLPGAHFDMAPNRSKVKMPTIPGVKTDIMADVREIKGPKGVQKMAIGVAKEVAPSASRLTKVGLGKLKAPSFKGEFQTVQQQYASADVAGEKGIAIVRETAPNVIRERTKTYGVRTEMPPSIAGRGKQVGVSRIAGASGVTKGITAPGGGSKGSAVPRPGAPAGTSRVASVRSATSKTSTTGLKQPAPASTRPSSSKTSNLKKPSKLKPKTESAIKKFDRLVNAELKRRHDPGNVLVEATTSDVHLLEAVDHLVRAEAMDKFAGTVRAAEEAAASVPPELAEEAALAAAKDYETKLTHVAKEVVSGEKPIQVIGYIGITKPKKPVR